MRPTPEAVPAGGSPSTTGKTPAERVEAIRRFNRFYTKQVGALGEGLLRTPHPLPEARLLYEIGRRGSTSASELREALDLDAGYLSRLLRRLERKDLVQRRRSPHDGRRHELALTPSGAAAYASLDEGSAREIRAWLERLGDADQARLVDCLQQIEALLRPEAVSRPPFVLRPPHPGDLGWVVARHGAIYAREYGWDDTFETLVAEIVLQYRKEHDSKRERCWIAEREAEPVGSVFLVRASDELAKLRLLLVEPSARGLGIGKALVDECVRTAQRLGYRRMTLWTQSVLVAARRIYERAGFELVHEKPSRAFGHDLVSETWERDL